MNDSHPVLTSTKGAVLILEAAAAEGMPAPRHIGVMGDVVDIQLRSPEEVQAWATWQEGPAGAVIVSHGSVSTTERRTPVFHDYPGVMFDQRFKVYAVTYCPCTSDAPEHEHGTGGYDVKAEVSA